MKKINASSITFMVLLVSNLLAFSGNSQNYDWCQCISNLETSNKALRADFKADKELGVSKLKKGNLVTDKNVIIAGDSILTIQKAVMYDDQESNPDLLYLEWVPISIIKDEFGSGNKWANWHVVVYDVNKTRVLWETYLQGPGRSPGGNCEWVDEKDYKPQILTYTSYGIYDWDWVIDSKKYNEVLVYLYEGDRGIGDDPIGYFQIKKDLTINKSLKLSDADYKTNPDGHDVDLTFTTSTFNIDKIKERKNFNKEPDWKKNRKSDNEWIERN